MANLHGNPFAYLIRTELETTKATLWEERQEHFKTRTALRFAQAQIEELEAKLERVRDCVAPETSKGEYSAVA
jgi:hypothetical protein